MAGKKQTTCRRVAPALFAGLAVAMPLALASQTAEATGPRLSSAVAEQRGRTLVRAVTRAAEQVNAVAKWLHGPQWALPTFAAHHHDDLIVHPARRIRPATPTPHAFDVPLTLIDLPPPTC